METHLPSARVVAARSHYPDNLGIAKTIPYRQVISPDSQVPWNKVASTAPCAQVTSNEYKRATCYSLLVTFKDYFSPTYYEYSISTSFRREHCNPPIWQDYHSHDFVVTLVLRSPLRKGDLYAVDMVEAEKLLQQALQQIPERINDLPSCPNGTTEQLCSHLLNTIKFSDRAIKIKSVSVSETSGRVTEVKSQKSKVKSVLLATRYLLLVTLFTYCLICQVVS